MRMLLEMIVHFYVIRLFYLLEHFLSLSFYDLLLNLLLRKETLEIEIWRLKRELTLV